MTAMKFGEALAILGVALPMALCRAVVIGISLGLWFWTQRLLEGRPPAAADTPNTAVISDGIHRLTARNNQRLRDSPLRAKALLIASSLVIDLLGIYLLASAILGPTFQPFLGLLMLFALRQACQVLCPLPAPQGMIWQDPGFPALLVTYGTSNDLFFSGHTAIAVYGAATLATALGTPGIVLGLAIAIFEIAAVLRLRAHYTMDVFTGAVTALYVHRLAIDFAPHVDRWMILLAKMW